MTYNLFRYRITTIGATTLALLLFACSGETPPDNLGDGGLMHGTPWLSSDDPGVQPQAAPAPHLAYYGGPVLQSVKITGVFWGAGVGSIVKQGMPGFYVNIVNSPYLDWLSEYNTTKPVQSIVRGSYAGTVTITPSPTGASLTDAQIQAELAKQIGAGHLPKPEANSLYMIHLPAGLKITQGKYVSCISGGFCAYHGTMAMANQNVYYGVLPDIGPGSGCDLGCGRAATQFDNQTSVASHEMVEAITDAGVGLATVYGPPLGWYDGTNGEIGDICNGQQGTMVASGVIYTVQKQWSNQAHACIVSRAVVPSDFSLALTPPNRIIGQHATTTYTVQTTAVSGMAAQVALSVTGLPGGVTGSFNPPSVTAGASSTLTVVTSPTNASVSATFVVTGTGGEKTHTVPGQIAVLTPNTNLIDNGDFESGKLSPFTPSSTAALTTATPHAGKFSVMLGLSTPYTTDGTLAQNIVVPDTGTTVLSFWYKPTCKGTLATDWQQVQLREVNGGAVIWTPMRTCATAGWTQVTMDLTVYSGRSMQVVFQAHDDGKVNTPSWMQLDDVAVLNR